MAAPDLAAIFARAIAVALASTTCVVACGARTNLTGEADDEEVTVKAPACVKRPQPQMTAKATCEGDSYNYDFKCDAMWALPRPPDAKLNARLSEAECGALCGNPPDYGAGCGEYCTSSANECEVGCDWLICRVDYSGGRRTSMSSSAGRRPPGFEHAAAHEPTLGGYFFRAAELEAASVVAFGLLARELEAHGAPPALTQAAARAAAEEAQHARAMNGLARTYGAERDARVGDRPPSLRPLATVALDNAVEGCVNETYAALVATWQSERAADPEVRATMKRIAADETSHARFSWSLHAWADERLTSAVRAELLAARAAAFAKLARALATDELDLESRRLAGLPSAREAAALLTSLASDLA